GKQGADDYAADEVADRKTVRFGLIVGVVGSNETSRPRHVFNNDRRHSGNMLSQMPRYGARIGIKPASGRKANNDTNGFSVKLWFLSVNLKRPKADSKNVSKIIRRILTRARINGSLGVGLLDYSVSHSLRNRWAKLKSRIAPAESF